MMPGEGEESKAYSVHGPAIYIQNLVITKESVDSFLDILDKLMEFETKLTVNFNLKELKKTLKKNA